MSDRSKSTLFLTEQLIVITVFAVCAAICASIFVDAYLTANDTSDLNRALIVAKNGAECYKAFGDLEETAAALGGGKCDPDGARAVVYYDRAWLVCGEAEAAYALRLEGVKNAVLPLLCELSVKNMTGEEIIAFTVARGARGE